MDPGQKPWYKFHVTEYTADQLEELCRNVFDNVEVKGIRAEDNIQHFLITSMANYRKLLPVDPLA